MVTAAAAVPDARAQIRLAPALAAHRAERVDVVGVAGIEGAEVARLLLAAGFTHVVGHDQAARDAFPAAFDRAHAGLRPAERAARRAALLAGLAGVRLGAEYLGDIGRTTLVIPGQAWFLHPANAPLQALAAAGTPFYSLTQAYLDGAAGTVIGVSGSHGKTTTTWLLAALARAAGRFTRVHLAGNDRHNAQCLLEVATGGPGDCLILEISNRQLLQATTAPAVACLTNVTPNHLGEHGGLSGYLRAKHRLFTLPGNRVAVRNGDDPLSLRHCPPAAGATEWRFAANARELGGHDGAFEAAGTIRVRIGGREQPVVETGALRLLGAHNRANVRAALATLAAATGTVAPQAAAALQAFPPLRHRLQLVWQQDGVDWIDDLNSTTPQSTVAAVRALGRPCRLIAGGDDKGLDFAELAGLVPDPVREVILLPGAGSERLRAALAAAGAGGHGRPVADLAAAVAAAAGAAQPGEAVLLSPGCPGVFGAFYGPGGFRAAVRRLVGGATSPPPRRGSG